MSIWYAINMDLSDLNIEQAAAVKHTYGPQLVVAGAGTGKTTVITRRIAYLLEQNLAKPQEILALTFTEKAAGELLDRLDVLLGWQAYQVNAMTFHAFGSQLISRFAHRLGMSSHSQVLTETSKLVLLKDNIDSLKLGYYGRQQDMLDFVRSKLELISELQNQDITPVIYRQIIEAKKIEGTLHEQVIFELEDNALIYDLYESVKRKYNVIDYYDQIQIPLLLLQQNPHIVEKLSHEYQFFMVDE